MQTIVAISDAKLRKYLGMSDDAWAALDEAGTGRILREVVPELIELEGKLEQLQWVFTQLKEHKLSDLFQSYEARVLQFKNVLVARVASERTDHKAVLEKLVAAQPRLAKLTKKLEAQERKTIVAIRKATTSAKPKNFPRDEATKVGGFIEQIRNYWQFLDRVWGQLREALAEGWRDLSREGINELNELSHDLLNVRKATAVFEDIIEHLEERSEYFNAQNLRHAKEHVQDLLRTEGLIPASQLVTGGWKVARDDCPKTELPAEHTKLTDSSAYCRSGKKRCPAFHGARGEFIKCSAAQTMKTGVFLKQIGEADDQLMKQLKAMAIDDPYIQQLLHDVMRTDEKAYFAKVLDPNLLHLLEVYPRTSRRGVLEYTMYFIGNSPLLYTNDFLIAADRALLETIDSGTGMPKTAHVKLAAVMRCTFTSNARLDPCFRDYMRKMKAIKITPNTWDIPYSREQDIAAIKNELKDDFGYPISIFQLLENPEITSDGRRYDRYTLAACMVMKPAEFEFSPQSARIAEAEELYKVLVALPVDHAAAPSLKRAVAGLRIGGFWIVAHLDDMYKNADGTVGIIPEPGMRFRIRDVESPGTMIPVEMQGKKATGRWNVKRLDDGKRMEITDRDLWIRPNETTTANVMCGDGSCVRGSMCGDGTCQMGCGMDGTSMYGFDGQNMLVQPALPPDYAWNEPAQDYGPIDCPMPECPQYDYVEGPVVNTAPMPAPVPQPPCVDDGGCIPMPPPAPPQPPAPMPSQGCPCCGFCSDPVSGVCFDTTYPCPSCGEGGATVGPVPIDPPSNVMMAPEQMQNAVDDAALYQQEYEQTGDQPKGVEFKRVPGPGLKIMVPAKAVTPVFGGADPSTVSQGGSYHPPVKKA